MVGVSVGIEVGVAVGVSAKTVQTQTHSFLKCPIFLFLLLR